VDRRPAKYGFYRSVFTMNDHALAGCDLVIHAAVSLQVNQAFRRDVVYKPTDLIGMRSITT
jgi:hypothetical protein